MAEGFVPLQLMGKPLTQITFEFVATEETEHTPEVVSSVMSEEKEIMETKKPVTIMTEEKAEPASAIPGKRGRRSLKEIGINTMPCFLSKTSC